MKSVRILLPLLASTAVVSSASAAQAPSPTPTATTYVDNGVSYAAYAPMTSAQQSAALTGAISPSLVPAGSPEYVVALPSYQTYQSAMTGGLVYDAAHALDPIAPSYTLTPSYAVAVPCVTGATPVTKLNKVWSVSGNYGNSLFGSNYLAKLTLAMQNNAGTTSDSVSAEAYGKFGVTVFGQNGAVTASALGKVVASNASVNVNVMVNASTAYTKAYTYSAAKALTTTPWQTSMTLATASTLVWIGPVPVTLRAQASGTLSFTTANGFSNGTLQANATPGGSLNAAASAGVNLGIASAGVTASMRLIGVSVPATTSVGLVQSGAGYQVRYAANVDAVVDSLSGRVDAWAKVGFSKWTKKYTANVANWSGFKATYPIVALEACSGVF
jgi:hypothetical protein